MIITATSCKQEREAFRLALEMDSSCRASLTPLSLCVQIQWASIVLRIPVTQTLPCPCTSTAHQSRSASRLRSVLATATTARSPSTPGTASCASAEEGGVHLLFVFLFSIKTVYLSASVCTYQPASSDAVNKRHPVHWCMYHVMNHVNNECTALPRCIILSCRSVVNG